MAAAATVVDLLAGWLVDPRRQMLAEEAAAAARCCLLDWLGVSLAAVVEPEARILARVAAGWRSGGDARLLSGGLAAPAVAALVNGGLSHALDFDDTHIPSVMHGSGPLWAALLAVGGARRLPPQRLLAAFAAGFQVGAALGGEGVGVRLTSQGWHATPVLGRIGAAAALAHALELDAVRTAHALALAATGAGGLNASFGSMAKPLHAGQAAMGAVIATELAEAGYEGAAAVFEAPGGLFPTLLQDAGLALAPALDGRSALLDNSFKPYAACQLTHAALDAARAAAISVAPAQMGALRVFVHPLAARVAARQVPATATEARFSLAWCIALGLHGHAATPQDFAPARLAEPALQALAAKVQVVADKGEARTSARLEIELNDGRLHLERVEHAFGSPGRPMDWPALEQKFRTLTAHLPAEVAGELLAAAGGFGAPDSLRRLDAALAQAAAAPRSAGVPA